MADSSKNSKLQNITSLSVDYDWQCLPVWVTMKEARASDEKEP